MVVGTAAKARADAGLRFLTMNGERRRVARRGIGIPKAIIL